MDREETDKPLVEPEIVPCVFLSGAKVWVDGGVMRFVGYSEEDGECRVRVRYAISLSTAQEIHKRNKALLGGH